MAPPPPPVANDGKAKAAPPPPVKDTTVRDAIIAVFVLGAVAGQVLVARRNTQTLKDIAKRTGVKFEKPKRSKKDMDDDWF